MYHYRLAVWTLHWAKLCVFFRDHGSLHILIKKITEYTCVFSSSRHTPAERLFTKEQQQLQQQQQQQQQQQKQMSMMQLQRRPRWSLTLILSKGYAHIPGWWSQEWKWATSLTFTYRPVFEVLCLWLSKYVRLLKCLIALGAGDSNVGERARRTGHAIATCLVADVRFLRRSNLLRRMQQAFWKLYVFR